ncbi:MULTISPECIES: hypothetical protein [Cellulophaga]|uniref:Uncharacterized protein n=2 Tax=Cellulophaga TaxID=104264 RepID=F0RFD9_CELLC|nr:MULTISPECIES: hypothetical protein [Cellulophaga]ADY27881.1 hypothetical protein Celly_0046 [Cellulophaga lytica DSM 7489]AIM62125.1 hypothetical protein IX49_16930 [Cellulophaga lytica]APU08768.1 hypothetical protein A5M85_00225 [Cellulophaga lytica]EWH10699.1 hypothetical protein KLA_16482 [Cellulophaga geojensis KL-A]MDO6853032.1 hypothetical protein [Cellulophaga lytica]
MKAIITLLFIITVGVTAQAQEAKVTPVLKMETTEIKAAVVKKEAVQQETKVARLYKFKNSKVKKALSFSTKRSKSKIA